MKELQARELVQNMLRLPILFRKQISQPCRALSALPPMQLYVLGAIEAHACINMTNLSREVAVKSQQLTRLVEALVERGYVERVSDPTNRRVVLVRLTEFGSAFLREIHSQLVESLFPLFKELPQDDLRTLHQAIGVVQRLILRKSDNE